MGDRAAVEDWLLASNEQWTRYQTLRDLEARPPDDPELRAAHAATAEDEQVRALIGRAGEWPGYALKRHNDAAHPLYALSTLADFGLTREDPGIAKVAESVLAHFDGEGFETLLWLPRFLTREAEDSERWTWMLCDTPTLLYALLAFGYAGDERVQAAVEALATRVADNGWRCGAASSLPAFGGPGRRDDTCPMATVYALRALSLAPAATNQAIAVPGVEALLSHWEHQRDYKLRMFGVGTDFRKLRYPFVWYDLLHVCDVLSRYRDARQDARFGEMVEVLTRHADEAGRYTAGSMYRAWKGWSFADKTAPSPWLTFLARRVERRSASV